MHYIHNKRYYCVVPSFLEFTKGAYHLRSLLTSKEIYPTLHPHRKRFYMVAHIHTIAFEGIRTILVNVQVHISPGKFIFSIVGLAEKAVKESSERIRSAIASIGLSLPYARIIINLAPADLIKEGTHYDLPITLAILVHMGVIPQAVVSQYLVMGELSLDGSIASVPGVLPAAVHATGCQKDFICPASNGKEARWAGDLTILAPEHILSLLNHFKGTQILAQPTLPDTSISATYPDISDIKGQQIAKRGLEIAASGGHNLLMIGPPGSGKSMLASRLPGILPPLSSKDILDVSMIASITGKLSDGTIHCAAPFRNPHHSCSMAAMVGGGRKALPGEITLAHCGVLFLDELPEFPRPVLESLRQPLETGTVTVSRAEAHITYPAHFQLIAAMNPCRCGYLGDNTRHCAIAPRCGSDYQSKLSGPFLDRIDLQIEVTAVTPDDLKHHGPDGESSATVLSRVTRTRQIQAQRYKDQSFLTNARADGELLRTIAKPDAEGQALLDRAFASLGLSMRGYHRILRVARTLADMRLDAHVRQCDIAEALGYRRMEWR